MWAVPTVLPGQGRCGGKWETRKAGFWDKAVAGSSALQAGLARAFNHEIHHHLGLTTGSIFYDMETFYDTLDPTKVVEQAIGLGYEATSLFFVDAHPHLQ